MNFFKQIILKNYISAKVFIFYYTNFRNIVSNSAQMMTLSRNYQSWTKLEPKQNLKNELQ